jgi:hypothetical protein
MKIKKIQFTFVMKLGKTKVVPVRAMKAYKGILEYK